MKITGVEVIPVEVALTTSFHGSHYSMSHRAALVTRVFTDDGVVGECYNGDEIESQPAIARIILEELAPAIQGLDPFLVERCWESMLPSTFDILRERKLPLVAMAAVDSAIWDIVGKATGQSLHRMWGGYRDELPMIAIGGYYERSEAELADEVESYLELEIHGCKMKVGGASPEVDAGRFIAMRRAGGDEFVLMADANQGYTPKEAARFSHLIRDYGMRWFEEPVHWYNDRLAMRDLRYRTGAAIAAGQSEQGRAGARDLMVSGAIDVCNFDASWGGGPTEWLRVAGMAAAFGVEMGHHEEPQISAQLIASIPHGTYVECFHPDRDPVFWNLIENRQPIRDGIYTVPDDPGWGLTLDRAWIERHRVDKS